MSDRLPLPHDRASSQAHSQDTPRWLDRKENVTKVAWALYATCASLVILEVFIHRHGDVGADNWFGFYAAYGFFGSVFLVMVAKQMRRLLKRPEDYYER